MCYWPDMKHLHCEEKNLKNETLRIHYVNNLISRFGR